MYYTCERCGCDVHESYPKKTKDNYVYCWECSLAVGLIDGCEYLKYSAFCLKNARARYNFELDLVEITTSKFPDEYPENKMRNTPMYKRWRIKVLERDNKTCQKCNKTNCKLFAHHIKAWKDYKKLRFDVDNGITLCHECHREEHRKAVKDG